MASSRELEQEIENVERLKVRIVNENGRRVRSDAIGFDSYPYLRAASGKLTVAAWKSSRFFPNYEGYDIEVLDEGGVAVHGGTRLATVRRPAFTDYRLKESINSAEAVQDDAEITENQDNAIKNRVKIDSPKLVIETAVPLPSIEINADRLPYPGSLENAIFSATKNWLKKKKLLKSGTIWKACSPSCNFIEHGMVWSIFVVPIGFGPNFLEFLYEQISVDLNYVRYGEYVSLNVNDGWSGVCHVQDGKVYEVLDEITWCEVE